VSARGRRGRLQTNPISWERRQIAAHTVRCDRRLEGGVAGEHAPPDGRERHPPRRSIAVTIAGLALFAGVAAPTTAITNNYVPDFEHPFVGLVVFTTMPASSAIAVRAGC
jgi:hypothetical protein